MPGGGGGGGGGPNGFNCGSGGGAGTENKISKNQQKFREKQNSFFFVVMNKFPLMLQLIEAHSGERGFLQLPLVNNWVETTL